MKVAITGGTGFVGGHLARALAARGDEVLLIVRGNHQRDEGIRVGGATRFSSIDVGDAAGLRSALAGYEAIAHCAGINREIGDQTYRKVHVDGTQNIIDAAKDAGARRFLYVSFLRARPSCGSRYHEPKWAAEELVRGSGLDYTILKPGVMYGRGDHMLEHLSRAFHTFPIFALVGLKEKPVRPVAIEDAIRILVAALTSDRLSRSTVAVTGPELLQLGAAVRRVADAVGRKPLMFRMPIWFHRGFAWCCERAMKIPLVSSAQVRILSEGVAEPAPGCDSLPDDLAPRTHFTREQIVKGLPEPGSIAWKDLRCSCS